MSQRSDEIVRDFISQRAPGIHPAFAAPSRFNIMTSQYEWDEALSLQETLRALQTEAPGQLDFSPEDCSWDDMLRELARAKGESSANGKKIVRKAWRAAGTAATVLGPGLDALPDEVCVLKGGLAVIFSLARQRQQIRFKILDAFEQIPNIIQMAQSKSSIFPCDERFPESLELHNSLWELYKTLIRTIPELIADLNPDTRREHRSAAETSIWSKHTLTWPVLVLSFKNVFRGGRSTEELLGIISNSSAKVRLCTECLTDRLRLGNYKTIKQSSVKTTEIHEITKDIREQLSEMRSEMQFNQTYLFGAIAGKNSLLQFMQEHSKSVDYSVSNGPASMGGSTLYESPTSPAYKPGELLGLLEVHHLSHIEDQRRVLSSGHSLDGEEMTRAAFMVKTPQVKHWLHAPSSSVVLIEGCGNRATMGRVAALSYACATYVHVLSNMSPEGNTNANNTTLFFFCGQHVTETDSLQGPQGLMRSLLAQLILTLVQNSWVMDTAPIKLLHKQGLGAKELEQFSIQDACQLFHQLLSAVPSGSTVFALVDGISYFEHREVWRGEFDLIIECLARIIADKAMSTVFKLLFTSPTTTSSASFGRLDESQRVRLRAGTTAATEQGMRRSL